MDTLGGLEEGTFFWVIFINSSWKDWKEMGGFNNGFPIPFFKEKAFFGDLLLDFLKKGFPPFGTKRFLEGWRKIFNQKKNWVKHLRGWRINPVVF